MRDDSERDRFFAFVQDCQIAIGLCETADYATQSRALWDCLDGFPRQAADAIEPLPAAVAVYHLACGFFNAFERSRENVHSLNRRAPRRWVNDVLYLVIAEYEKPTTTLGSLARRLEVSASYLSHALAIETGHSFPVHLNGIRILAAMTHLGCGGQRVKSVAAAVGYLSTAELDRQFSKRFALSPKSVARLLQSWRARQSLGQDLVHTMREV